MNKTSSAICQSQKYWTLLIFIRILEIGALTGFMYIAIIIVRACIFFKHTFIHSGRIWQNTQQVSRLKFICLLPPWLKIYGDNPAFHCKLWGNQVVCTSFEFSDFRQKKVEIFILKRWEKSFFIWCHIHLCSSVSLKKVIIVEQSRLHSRN